MKMAWACKVVFSSLLLIAMVQCAPFRVEDINEKWNAMESNMAEESVKEIVSDKRKRFDDYYPQKPEYRQEYQKGMKQNQGFEMAEKCLISCTMTS